VQDVGAMTSGCNWYSISPPCAICEVKHVRKRGIKYSVSIEFTSYKHEVPDVPADVKSLLCGGAGRTECLSLANTH